VTDCAELEAEGFERSAVFIVDRHALLQQRSAIAQQETQLLAFRRLDVDGGEPPDAHGMRDCPCVVAIDLDRHGDGRALHPSGLDANGRQPRLS
jgi:hypothetical protein